MRSFLAFLKEATEDRWFHVHRGDSFELKAKVPDVSPDSTIPQAKGKVGLFVTQQPWLWKTYGGEIRTHCTEILLPAGFTDYLEGVGERFVTNLTAITVGKTLLVDDVQQNNGN